MSSHIAARGTRPLIATAIAAVCCGAAAVPGLAALAVTAPVASRAGPDGTPWG
jgi:hypothetical protein